MSPRTDFYLLTQTDEKSQLLTVCRIVEKAYLNAHQIFILCNNESQSNLLDTLLWTFKDISFIPHARLPLSQASNALPPVLIGQTVSSPPSQDILINLADNPPNYFNVFQRIIEVIPNEETAKARGRHKYKFYREQQYELHSHNLS